MTVAPPSPSPTYNYLKFGQKLLTTKACTANVLLSCSGLPDSLFFLTWKFCYDWDIPLFDQLEYESLTVKCISTMI